MERIKKAIDWISRKWTQGIALAKQNKGKTAAACVVASLFITGSALANHYYNANSTTLYHVYVDGVDMGTVDHPDIIQQYIDKQIIKQKAKHGPLRISVDNRIEFKEDHILYGKADNEQTLEQVKRKIELKVAAQSLVINGETVAYAPDQVTIESVIQEIKGKYGPLPVANDKTKTVKTASHNNGSEIKSVSFKEKIEMKSGEVSPDRVLNREELKTLLEKGSLQQVVHTVKEGDCLGCIANQYHISIDDISRANPGIDENTLLQLGQEIIVTVPKPKLTVETVEQIVEERIIDYDIEVKPTQTMYRGETKVVQEGQEGRKKITYQVVKENGVQVEKKVLEEVVLSEPVKKIIHKGTKVKPGRGDGQFIWPANGGSITSAYGPRWGRMHEGLDIAGVSNKTIKAADNGRVTLAGWNGNYGKCVIIDHGNGYTTLYGHLSSIDVSVGDVVEKGDKIGVMGSTGDSTGTHLHFEVMKNGTNTDPLQYFRGR